MSVPLNKKRATPPTLVAFCLLLVGCNVNPTSYAQWKKDQATRAKFDAAGVPYKSPSQLRAEAAEMRQQTENTTFAPAGK